MGVESVDGRGVRFDGGFLEDEPGKVEKIVGREKIAGVPLAWPEIVDHERLAVDLDLDRQKFAAIGLKRPLGFRRLESESLGSLVEFPVLMAV